jgi:hypothetical protein
LSWWSVDVYRLPPGRPEKINVAILKSDHDYLADAVGETDKPLYEVIHAKLISEIELKEAYKEKCEFLEMAIADKTIFREENERLRQEIKSFHSYTYT